MKQEIAELQENDIVEPSRLQWDTQPVVRIDEKLVHVQLLSDSQHVHRIGVFNFQLAISRFLKDENRIDFYAYQQDITAFD